MRGTPVMRKYLLRKYTDGGHYDSSVGALGEVVEYGADSDNAIARAMEKYGGSRSHWMKIGVLSE